MAKRVSRGGLPRGPRPGRKSEASLRKRKESQSENKTSRSIVPPWKLSADEERLWKLIVPELQRIGAAEPLDAVTISSIISGVVLERRTVEDILSGAEEMVLTGSKGNGYMNPLIAGYLSIRKANLAAMAEAGMTRSRREGMSEDASIVAAVEAERLTQVHEQVKLLVKGKMSGDDDGGKASVRDDDPPALSGGDAPL